MKCLSSAGKCWMDALELALRCSSLLKRTMVVDGAEPSVTDTSLSGVDAPDDSFLSPLRNRDALNESDCERHFQDYGLEDDRPLTDRDEGKKEASESDTEPSEEEDEKEVRSPGPLTKRCVVSSSVDLEAVNAKKIGQRHSSSKLG